jgi:uncharacterized protein involved in cysteine biosynthesis
MKQKISDQVEPSHTPVTRDQAGWLPPARALWSLCWRLFVMLTFLIGALMCVLLKHWGACLGCIVGFLIAAFIIRRSSTVEDVRAPDDSIVFL